MYSYKRNHFVFVKASSNRPILIKNISLFLFTADYEGMNYNLHLSIIVFYTK